MSVLLYIYIYTRPGGLFFVNGMEHCFRMSSKDACAFGFIDLVVMKSRFPLKWDRKVGSIFLIDRIFIDIGIISLYIMSVSML